MADRIAPRCDIATGLRAACNSEASAHTEALSVKWLRRWQGLRSCRTCPSGIYRVDIHNQESPCIHMAVHDIHTHTHIRHCLIPVPSLSRPAPLPTPSASPRNMNRSFFLFYDEIIFPNSRFQRIPHTKACSDARTHHSASAVFARLPDQYCLTLKITLLLSPTMRRL